MGADVVGFEFEAVVRERGGVEDIGGVESGRGGEVFSVGMGGVDGFLDVGAEAVDGRSAMAAGIGCQADQVWPAQVGEAVRGLIGGMPGMWLAWWSVVGLPLMRRRAAARFALLGEDMW